MSLGVRKQWLRVPTQKSAHVVHDFATDEERSRKGRPLKEVGITRMSAHSLGRSTSKNRKNVRSASDHSLLATGLRHFTCRKARHLAL